MEKQEPKQTRKAAKLASCADVLLGSKHRNDSLALAGQAGRPRPASGWSLAGAHPMIRPEEGGFQ